jgi:pheromone shutdown protein TraB
MSDKVYEIKFTLHAHLTAYVSASSEEEAEEMIENAKPDVEVLEADRVLVDAFEIEDVAVEK